MTLDDSYKIIMTLKAVYNTAYSKYTVQDFDNLATAWQSCLNDYPYEVVSIGVKAYMTTNTSQFPPVPSQIIDLIQKLSPQNDLNENEAWSMVYKAICRSSTHAQEEYDKLPPTVQKAVGSPDNLRAMATDDKFSYGVAQSNFFKVYAIEQARAKEVAKLPNSIREAIGIATQERVAITG